jgi:transcription termination factor NusB
MKNTTMKTAGIKITKTLAEALAEQVQTRIEKSNDEARKAKIAKLEESKDFKEFVTLIENIRNKRNELNDLIDKFEKKREQFDKKYEKDNLRICAVNTRYGYDPTSVSLSSRSKGLPSTKDIANNIIVEAAFAESSTTSEEFINKIVSMYM